MDYARKWAKDHGLTLDSELTLRDEGLSAYHQNHIKQGALGTFLRAVEDGQIAPHSVLIVEGLDRLSRAEPMAAQAQLGQIINAGITVVTASDGKQYNRESLKANPMDLVFSLLVMIRAHEESDTKSKRVIAAITKQCEGWLKGTFRGQIRNGCDPDWVIWDGTKFVEIPDRANAVRVVVDMFMLGHGGTVIHNRLKESGQYFEKGNIYNIVRRPDLIGQKVLTVGGKEYKLEDYYPRIISDEMFYELQDLIKKRTRQRGKGDIPGVITGINVAVCGYCGYTIVSNNLMSSVRKKPDGKPLDGHRRLKCCGQNGRCPVPGTTGTLAVERAIFSYCSDQINLSSLMVSNEDLRDLNVKRQDVIRRAEQIAKHQARILDAMLVSDDNIQIFVAKQQELAIDAKNTKEEQIAIEAEIARANNTNTVQSSSVWQSIADGALNLEHDSRMIARRLVEDTFNKIVIYGRGIHPSQRNQHVDILLIPRFGHQRWIRVDRKTGDWNSGLELTGELEFPFLS